ncbi:MAG: ABC transporter permease [Verrucomicrobiota bacterium]
MRHFLTLFSHELRMLLIAPATYIASVLFLLLMGLIYLLALNEAASVNAEQPPSELFFQVFWVPVFFMVPLLTMRSIAEERRLGTLETLMTTPATAFQVVLSKFLGAYVFYLLLWGLTISFPYLAAGVLTSAEDKADLLEIAPMLGGYLFIALSGMLYVALGIFASSLTRSQLVAGMLCFSMLFIIVISGQLLLRVPVQEYAWMHWLEGPLDYVRSFKHLEDFSRGVVDTRPFFLYFSNAALLLGLTTLVVESKA